jgi:hypothetical protein
LISRIQEELDVVKSDVRLTFLVLREIGKILRLLAERAEYQVINLKRRYYIVPFYIQMQTQSFFLNFLYDR